MKSFSWMKCTSSTGDSFIMMSSKIAHTHGGIVLRDQRKLLKVYLRWVASFWARTEFPSMHSAAFLSYAG